MMLRLFAAAFAVIASIGPSSAQNCGSQNPNCIVPTRPAGDSTNAAASTAFVTGAISGFTPFPSPTRAGDIIFWNGSIWTNLPGNNSGTQVLQETSSGVPSWASASSSGTLVSIQAFTSTQTITIPAGATKAFIEMSGATGGSGGAAAVGPLGSGGTGAGGSLFKYLTGLTPGNTLAYTQGAAGAAGSATPGAGGNGGTTTLASGTQTISTLTCNASNGSAAANTSNAGTAGATATGGDLNITGASGSDGFLDGNSVQAHGGAPGSTGTSVGAQGKGTTSTNVAGNAGNAGHLIIYWFS